MSESNSETHHTDAVARVADALDGTSRLLEAQAKEIAELKTEVQTLRQQSQGFAEHEQKLNALATALSIHKGMIEDFAAKVAVFVHNYDGCVRTITQHKESIELLGRGIEALTSKLDRLRPPGPVH